MGSPFLGVYTVYISKYFIRVINCILECDVNFNPVFFIFPGEKDYTIMNRSGLFIKEFYVLDDTSLVIEGLLTVDLFITAFIGD